MQRTLITGASGVLGKALVEQWTSAGHAVRGLSRQAPAPQSPPGVEWVQADLATGEGIPAALEGVETIVHAASSPYRNTRAVDVEGTRQLLAAARRSGVEHFVFISIVGIERVPFDYYRQKLAAERLVEAGPVPWSILRATQFHNLLGERFIPLAFRLPLAFLPTDLLFQPIEVGEVAGRLAEIAGAGPAGRLADIGGPAVRRLGDLARGWMAAHRMERRLFHLPLPGKMAAAFRQGLATVPDNPYGRITWEQWLAENFKRSGIAGARAEPVAGQRVPKR